jgi:hypothetical protein
MHLAERGEKRREERLVKALRDNLRRRKATLGEPAKPAGENAGAPPQRQASRAETTVAKDAGLGSAKGD